jgi:carboxypeptidase C (cathepsin A)
LSLLSYNLPVTGKRISMTHPRVIATSLTILLAASAMAAQPDPQQRRIGRPGSEQATQPQAQTTPPAQAPRGPAPEEKSVVTKHSGRFGGVQMDYTATAATYVIRSDDGAPKATMFFVGYTKDGADAAKRPVSFVYNGGPGSASFWTHMGLGPKRVVLTDDGHGMPAPYSVVENGDSFLNATDLIFVDAIGTGFSRPAPGENPAQFYGVSQDAQWFADFIYQYLTRNERW